MRAWLCFSEKQDVFGLLFVAREPRWLLSSKRDGFSNVCWESPARSVRGHADFAAQKPNIWEECELSCKTAEQRRIVKGDPAAEEVKLKTTGKNWWTWGFRSAD